MQNLRLPPTTSGFPHRRPSPSASDAQFVVHQNRLYFQARNAEFGSELWVTDGTSFGTRLAADINPGPSDSDPSEITPYGNEVVFRAEHDVSGTELYAYKYQPEPRLYWTPNGIAPKIISATKDFEQIDTLISDSSALIATRLIEIDTTLGFTFHADSEKIYRSNADGTNYIEIYDAGFDDILDIAYDSQNGHLYVLLFDEFGANRGKIFRINNDGSGGILLHEAPVTLEPVAIAIDVSRQFIFYSETGFDQQSGDRVVRINLNGSGRTIIHDFGGEPSRSLAVNPNTGRIYMESGHMNNDGTDLQVYDFNFGPLPNDISRVNYNSADDKLYFIIDECKITKADIVAGAVVSVVSEENTFEDIVIHPNDQEIYWNGNSRDEYGKMDTTGNNYTIFLSFPIQGGATIEVDLKNEKIYFTDGIFRELFRSDLSGANLELIASDIGLNSNPFALDLRSGKVYFFTVDDRDFIIQRMNLNGSSREDVFALPSGLGIYDMTINSVDCRLYWTDAFANVYSIFLDGTDFQTILTGLNFPTSIEIDTTNQRLIWIAAGTNDIQSANFDGSGLTTLLTGLNRPFDLEVDHADGLIYWISSNPDSIRSANLDGSNPTALIELPYSTLSITCGLSMPMGECILCPTDTAFVSKVAVDTSFIGHPKIIADSTICSGINVDFIPSQCVDLNEGFEVISSGQISISIEDCVSGPN